MNIYYTCSGLYVCYTFTLHTFFVLYSVLYVNGHVYSVSVSSRIVNLDYIYVGAYAAVYVFSVSVVMSPRRIRCNRLGGADGVIPRAGGASRALTERSSSEGRDDRGSGGRDRATPSRTPESGNMQAVAEELQAGSRIPVTVDQIVNDTLVVTLTYRERSYTGILLDCRKQ